MVLGIDRRGWEEISGFAGILTLSVVRHWPIPYEDCKAWYGLFFDVMQDQGRNPDRAGMRRKRSESTPRAMSAAAGADAK